MTVVNPHITKLFKCACSWLRASFTGSPPICQMWHKRPRRSWTGVTDRVRNGRPPHRQRYHLGIVHYLRNELAAAERQLTPLVRQPYLAHVQCFLQQRCHVGPGLCWRKASPEKAREIAELMASFSRSTCGTSGIFTAKAFQAELALRQGRWPKPPTGQNILMSHSCCPCPFYRPAPDPGPDPVGTEHRPQPAARPGKSCPRCITTFTSTHCTSVMIEVLAVQALLYQAEGNEQAALEALQQAVTFAEPGGFIRTFVDLARRCNGCWPRSCANDRHRRMQQGSLAAFPQALSPAAAHIQANTAMLSPLTPRT